MNKLSLFSPVLAEVSKRVLVLLRELAEADRHAEDERLDREARQLRHAQRVELLHHRRVLERQVEVARVRHDEGPPSTRTTTTRRPTRPRC